MAVTWGSWTTGKSNNARVGLDLSVNSQGVISVARYVQFEFSVNDDMTVTLNGVINNTYAFRKTSPSAEQIGPTLTYSGIRGRTYTFRLKLSGVYNGAAPEVEAQITVPSGTPSAPGRPSISNVSSSGWKATVQKPASTGGSAITGYRWHWAANPGFDPLAGADVTTGRTRTFAGSPSTSYWVRARAINANGEGNWSAATKVTTKASGGGGSTPPTPPPPPVQDPEDPDPVLPNFMPIAPPPDWPGEVKDALRVGGVERIVRVAFTHPDVADELPLEFEAGTFTLDETATSHATLHISVQVPESQEVMDLLDPRTGARLLLYAGYRVPGQPEDVQQVADLALRERIIRRPENLMELRAESDESLLVSAIYLTGDVYTTGVAECLLTLINQLPGTQAVSSGVPLKQSPDLLEEFELLKGSPVWDALMTVADSAGVWVYCDALRGWHLTYPPRLAGKSAWQLSTGATGNVTQSESVLSVDLGYANTVAVVHEWRTEAGEDRRRVGVASVTGGDFAVSDTGQRAVVVRRDTPISQAAASQAAKALLARTVSRGRALNVDSPSAYWVRPGDTVTVQLPTGPQERHLVQRVVHDLGAANMTVLTRLPESVQVTTGE